MNEEVIKKVAETYHSLLRKNNFFPDYNQELEFYDQVSNATRKHDDWEHFILGVETAYFALPYHLRKIIKCDYFYQNYSFWWEEFYTKKQYKNFKEEAIEAFYSNLKKVKALDYLKENEPKNNLITKLRSTISDLSKQNILVADLNVIQSLDWLKDECEEKIVSKSLINKHEAEIFDMARTNYLKANTGEYFNNVDTAVCGAYLANYIADKYKVDSWNALDWLEKHWVFDGSDEESTKALKSFDENEFKSSFFRKEKEEEVGL